MWNVAVQNVYKPLSPSVSTQMCFEKTGPFKLLSEEESIKYIVK